VTWVYLDGAFVTAEEARVAAGDTAVLFGHGLFETFRARRGAVYLLDRHLARLRAGAETLGIEPPAELAGLAAIVRELSERCAFEEARVRLTLTAGAEGGRLAQRHPRQTPEGQAGHALRAHGGGRFRGC